eukprot:m.239239 g.239239  ORF g.239239 m.239239 type:complete len:71 (+) comp15294_c1_seq2:2276-2488(+)
MHLKYFTLCNILQHSSSLNSSPTIFNVTNARSAVMQVILLATWRFVLSLGFLLLGSFFIFVCLLLWGLLF